MLNKWTSGVLISLTKTLTNDWLKNGQFLPQNEYYDIQIHKSVILFDKKIGDLPWGSVVTVCFFPFYLPACRVCNL